MMSAEEVYQTTVRQLPPMDRLRLATLILDDLTATNGNGLDISDTWNTKDMQDLTAFSLMHAEDSYPGESNA